MADKVIITQPKKCDFCPAQAEYDFKTYMGPWANACEDDYLFYRAYQTLGTGKGQKLVLDTTG
jgi:hypothetical protein